MATPSEVEFQERLVELDENAGNFAYDVRCAINFIKAMATIVEVAQNDYVRTFLMPSESITMAFAVSAYRNIAVMEKKLK